MKPNFFDAVLLGSLLVLGLFPPCPCVAQVLLSPAFEDGAEEQRKDTTEQAAPIRRGASAMAQISLGPAPEPEPALRYRFWPAVSERRREEAMPFISRAILLSQAAVAFNEDTDSTYFDLFEEIVDAPLNGFPKDKANRFLERYADDALKELARAENRMLISYDLRAEELSISETVSLLLPELQHARNLARSLQVRIRLALAEQRWDDAVDDLRLGFRLAHATGRATDFFVGRLVGMAIASMMLDSVQEAITQPESPNLYWALATIPAAMLFEVESSVEAEMGIFSRLTGDRGRLPGVPIGDDLARVRLIEWIRNATRTLGVVNDVAPEIESLLAGIYAAAFAEPSRDLLAERTDWGDRARDLSAAEAVLRAAHFKINSLQQDVVKWFYLPEHVRADYTALSAQSLEQFAKQAYPVGILIGTLAPAVQAAYGARQRALQKVHWLLTLEALRMHAAAHGELPDALANLDPVPACDDPLTNEPFVYQRISATRAKLEREPTLAGEQETTADVILHLQEDKK